MGCVFLQISWHGNGIACSEHYDGLPKRHYPFLPWGSVCFFLFVCIYMCVWLYLLTHSYMHTLTVWRRLWASLTPHGLVDSRHCWQFFRFSLHACISTTPTACTYPYLLPVAASLLLVLPDRPYCYPSTSRGWFGRYPWLEFSWACLTYSRWSPSCEKMKQTFSKFIINDFELLYMTAKHVRMLSNALIIYIYLGPALKRAAERLLTACDLRYRCTETYDWMSLRSVAVVD